MAKDVTLRYAQVPSAATREGEGKQAEGEKNRHESENEGSRGIALMIDCTPKSRMVERTETLEREKWLTRIDFTDKCSLAIFFSFGLSFTSCATTG